MTRFILACTTAPLSLIGCSQSASHKAFPLNGPDSQLAGGLVDAATSSGSLWPITFASSLFLLASIPAFFILDRKQFIAILAVGVILAISPIVLLKILDHLVIPVAVLAGIAGAAVLVFFLGRLWDRWKTSRRAKAVAEAIRSDGNTSTLTDFQAADAIESVAVLRKHKK